MCAMGPKESETETVSETQTEIIVCVGVAPGNTNHPPGAAKSLSFFDAGRADEAGRARAAKAGIFCYQSHTH